MVDTNNLKWQDERKNVLSKHLARDNDRNLQIDIIKLEPNMTYSEHSHPDIEWVYVLEGSMSDENGTYEKDHFIFNKKNSTHKITSGSEGCKLIVIWCGKLN